ncbi:MAG: selenium-binding protein SBP56-related protein, partial [Isosphaeraceae bacterium]
MSSRSPLCRWIFGTPLVALAAAALTSTAIAETCLSPFVKRLDRPEKYLYVFCVDADAKQNDFVAVVDVNPDSPTHGTITHTLDLGSRGNETHHWGYTDDRTRIWAGGLLSSRIWLIDVATDPARPRVEKVLDDVPKTTGLSAPHTYYALPGRMLLSFLGAADGGTPAGLAEFTNDGAFIRRIDQPSEAAYGYDVAVKPERNRMVSSSFTPPRNYRKPLAEMDLTDFGSQMIVWDFKKRQPLQVAKAGLAPLEVRWSLKPENDYGFTNCALDNSLYLFRGTPEGSYEFKKVATTGALPADLRQSPDDRYLFVSCFNDNRIEQWDVSNPDQPTLFSTVSPGVQPNMMHVTGDGKRMYVTNSLLSTMDHAGRFWVRRSEEH